AFHFELVDGELAVSCPEARPIDIGARLVLEEQIGRAGALGVMGRPSGSLSCSALNASGLTSMSPGPRETPYVTMRTMSLVPRRVVTSAHASHRLPSPPRL